MRLACMVLTVTLGTAGGQTPEPARQAAQLVDQAEREINAGDYAAASRHAREAADISAAAGDKVHEARAVNRLGQAALYTGEYGPAAAAFQRAATLSAEGGDLEGQVIHLTNLGNVHFFIGRYSEAVRTYKTALTLVDAAQGADWVGRRRRIVLVNEAALYQRLGRDQEALEVYQGLDATALPPSEQAQLLVNKGVLYRRLGDPVKALSTYDEARRLFAQERHLDGELGTLKNRGIVLALDLQQLDAAERVFSEVAVLAERARNRRELLHAYLYRGETRLRAGRVEDAHGDFLAALPLARELKTPEEEWKAHFGLGRTDPRPDVAQEQLATAVDVIEKIRERIGVPSLRSDFFNDKTEVYDALITSRLATASATDIFSLVERSHSRAWRDRLGLSQPFDLPSVQRALPDRVLLLDYWTSPRGSALVAVTRSRAATLRVDVDKPSVDAFVRGLASGDGFDWREPSQALGASILPPAEWFAGIEHVIVVAPGPLALVPFELLSRSQGSLIERVTVSYTPTAATTLKPATQQPGWLPPWSLQLRAFGAPAGPNDGTTIPADAPGMLPASGAEVRAIASELGGAERLHLGLDDRKEYLLRPDEKAPVLHIASHASADSAALEQSRILFSPPAGATTPDFLYLREVYDLPLGDVQLAVLSACDTERGRVLRGEGVQSFSRAFLAAGAKSTVTTLWRVADSPTANFMEVFYHHLQRGESRAAALRSAKLRFLHSQSSLAHPHYWGAFVLSGDGLQPLPRAVSWTFVLASAIAFGIALSLAAWGLRRRHLPL